MFTLFQIAQNDELITDLEGVTAHLSVELFRRFDEFKQETIDDKTYFIDNRGAIIYMVADEDIYAPGFILYEDEPFYFNSQKKLLYRVFKGCENKEAFLAISSSLNPSRFHYHGPYLHYSDPTYAFTFKLGDDQLYDFDLGRKEVWSEYIVYSLVTLNEVRQR